MRTKQAREGDEHGKGTPRTEELYPGEPLPERGYGLSQAEPAPIAPLIFTGVFFGLLAFMLAKKP